jgi:hypothetical protein
MHKRSSVLNPLLELFKNLICVRRPPSQIHKLHSSLRTYWFSWISSLSLGQITFWGKLTNTTRLHGGLLLLSPDTLGYSIQETIGSLDPFPRRRERIWKEKVQRAPEQELESTFVSRFCSIALRKSLCRTIKNSKLFKTSGSNLLPSIHKTNQCLRLTLYILSRVTATETRVWISESVYWIFAKFKLQIIVTLSRLR